MKTLPDLGCACATLRRAARLVTQLYSEELGSEIEPTQYSLLTAIEHRDGINQARIGRALGLDKTTMSRSLGLLEKKGWIEVASNEDRREKGYRLSAAGEAVLQKAKPAWARAQAKLKANLDGVEWQAMLDVLNLVSEAISRRGAEAKSGVPPEKG